jgi:hypothetical protein
VIFYQLIAILSMPALAQSHCTILVYSCAMWS